MAEPLRIPNSEQPNLAPSDTFEKALQPPTLQGDPPFKDFLTERLLAYKNEEDPTWRELHSTWHLVALFIAGKHILRRTTFGSGWRISPMPESTLGPVKSYNLMRFYCDNVKVKWVQSTPKMVARPARDTDSAKASARAGGVITDHYKRKWFTPFFRQEEANFAMVCGNFARRVYYSEAADGGYAERDIVQPASLKLGEDQAYCVDCGYVGDARDFNQAPIQLGPTGQQANEPPQPGVPHAEPDADDFGGPSDNDADNLPGGEQPQAAGSAAPPPGGLPGSASGMGAAPAAQPQEVPIRRGPTPQEACPNCGSPNVLIDQMPEQQVNNVVGSQQVKVGDLCCEVIPFFNLRFDLAFRLEDSPWLIYRRRVRRDVLKGHYPALNIELSQTQDTGLIASDALIRSASAISGVSRSGLITDTSRQQPEMVDLVEMWLDPCLYADYVNPTPFDTLAGVTIPEGPLRDQFPDGICVMMVDDGKIILDVHNEHHRDHWVSSPFHIKPLTGIGDGVVDLVEIQRQFNQVNSQIYTQIRTASTPAILYDKDLMRGDSANYIGMAHQNIPVDLTGLPENRGIRDAVFPLAPQGIPGHVIQYAQQFLNNMFQLCAHTTDFSGGLPGVDNRTATGAQIAAANAQSLHAPYLELLADVNKRTMELALKLYQRHCLDRRYYTIQSKHGKQDGIWLRAADINDDISIEIIPESHLPQSGLERRERIKEFISFFGNVQGLMQAEEINPELVAQLTDLYDIDLQTDDYNIAAEVGRARIEQMRQFLPHVAQLVASMSAMGGPQGVVMVPQPVVDPQTGQPTGQTQMAPVPIDVFAARLLMNAIDPPPDQYETAHKEAADYYREWLTTDDGLESPKPLREAVKLVIQAELQFAAMEQAVNAGMQLAGSPAAGMMLAQSMGIPIGAPGQPGGPPGEGGGGGAPKPAGPPRPGAPSKGTAQEARNQNARGQFKSGSRPAQPKQRGYAKQGP